MATRVVQSRAKMIGVLGNLLFRLPPSPQLCALTATTVLSTAYFGSLEAMGRKHMQFSKFRNAPSCLSVMADWGSKKVPTRAGMLIFYTPALLAALAAGFAAGSARCSLVCHCLVLHFIKRDLEVMFVHQYSGYMIADTAAGISGLYLLVSVCTVYGQRLTVGLPEPSIDLTSSVKILFAVGILGNFYHHYILSKLRGKNDKEYKIPKGGLFGLVVCPHYLFEIIEFFGMAFMSQTWIFLAFALGSTFYLVARSHATKKWYLSKFEDFPGGVYPSFSDCDVQIHPPTRQSLIGRHRVLVAHTSDKF